MGFLRDNDIFANICLKLYQECLRCMLQYEVEQRSVGGDGHETGDRGGGPHGGGGIALPPIEMLQNCRDLDSCLLLRRNAC